MSVDYYAQRAHEFFAAQSDWLEAKNCFRTPSQILGAYNKGDVIGAATDSDELPHDLRQYARNCRDEFRDVIGRNQYSFAMAPGTGQLYGDWQGKICTPYTAHLQLDRRMAYVGRQLTGDCVSWAKRTARDQARSFDIVELRQHEEYVKRSATSDLYSMRGHTGEGASPSRVAMAATKIGILLEGPVTSPDGEVWDFSEYDSYYKIGVKHGRTGLPKWIFDLNREYGPKQVAEINDGDELCTALWNGNGVSVGSQIGVASTGGKDGVSFLSALKGSWAHDMAIIGFDDSKQFHRDTLIIWDQSWGVWNKLSGWPKEYGPRPEGAFVLTLTDTMRAVKGGECHAFSDSEGFRPRRQATLGAEGLI